MNTVVLTGEDTIKFMNKLMADLPEGDVVTMTFPNDMAGVKTGKNGNAIYSLNETGRQAEIVLRLMRGSDDDKYMLSLMAQQKNNFAGFTLLNGEFVKRVGDGQGNIRKDTYVLSGGVFTKQIEAKSNVEADTEQGISSYHLKFANVVRVIM